MTATPWLTEKRRLHIERFGTTPLPPRGLHQWRYTDPAELRGMDARAPETVSPAAETRLRMLHAQLAEGRFAAVAVDRAGRRTEVVRDRGGMPESVQLLSLPDALRAIPEKIEISLYSLIGQDAGHFEAENGARWEDGIFLHVPAKTDISTPIHLVHDAGVGGGLWPRTLVVVGAGARVTIVDEYIGGADDPNATAFCNGAIELIAGANSHVTYVCLQRQGAGVRSYLSHRARLGADAVMTTVPISLGGALSKQNFGIILDGANAESSIVGLLYGSGRQHFDNHTLHHHAAGQTRSNIDFKAVLQDRATSAYTGLIRIDKHARVCEAYQENRNLLLSPGARAQTIPELEILNEDVACTHGATVGPLDPLQLFYLKSRGINPAESVRMIVRGYFASTMTMLPEALRDLVIDAVEARLSGSTASGVRPR